MDGKFVAYYRVSTERQGRSGLGLEAQREAVASFLNGEGGRLLNAFRETESGKQNDRPALAEALENCRLTGAKLVVAKLDRLSRDSAFLMKLQNGAVPFVCADMPEANELTIGIMAVVAQAERKMISQRTKAALAQSKKKLGGWRGGPKVDPSTGTQARQARAKAFAAGLAPIVQPLRVEGHSLRQIAAELTARGIRTPRGGEWTADAVRTVLRRVGEP